MLHIIADDFGLAESVNNGIIFLLKEGKIDGASLMANGEAFDDAIQRLKDFSNANIGIHLVLVEEKPLTEVKSPKNHKIFFIKYILGLVNLRDIKAEIEAQIDKCLAAGVKPAFINSHQHLHLLPRITNIVIDLAQKHGILRIRIVNELPHGQGGIFKKTQSIFLKFLSSMAKRKIQRAGLKYNDFFIGFLSAGNLTNADIDFAKELSRKFPDKVVELGCHPGYEDDNLRNKYRHWGCYNWQKEIEVLKNSKL